MAVSFAAGRVCPSRAAGADVVPHCPACRGRVRHSARPPDTAAAGYMRDTKMAPAGLPHTVAVASTFSRCRQSAAAAAVLHSPKGALAARRCHNEPGPVHPENSTALVQSSAHLPLPIAGRSSECRRPDTPPYAAVLASFARRLHPLDADEIRRTRVQALDRARTQTRQFYDRCMVAVDGIRSPGLHCHGAPFTTCPGSGFGSATLLNLPRVPRDDVTFAGYEAHSHGTREVRSRNS